MHTRIIMLLLTHICFIFPGEDECDAGDVRLQGGRTQLEGRLEVCTQGSWTTVRSDQITYPEAQVICKQLGYDAECMDKAVIGINAFSASFALLLKGQWPRLVIYGVLVIECSTIMK